MGNRAMIVGKDSSLGLYVHWNGGRDSVEAFLEYASFLSSYGMGAKDNDLGFSTLVKVVANFMGSSCSVEIVDQDDLASHKNIYDNGVYIVDGWEIVDRFDAPVVEQNSYDRIEMLKEIDALQPAQDQLGEAYIEGADVLGSDLQVGDVIMKRHVGKLIEMEVLCLGHPEQGHVPCGYRDNAAYIGLYDADNPNSYVDPNATVRLVKRNGASKRDHLTVV